MDIVSFRYIRGFRGYIFRLQLVEKAPDGIVLPVCSTANSSNPPDRASTAPDYHHRRIARGVRLF
jgi:hypothetical protein